MARIRLKDVARSAGVSEATVSRALRNDARISEAVRAAVQRWADELGYVPDPALARLASYRQDREPGPEETIVHLTTWPAGQGLGAGSPIWQAVPEHCRRLGYLYEMLHVGTASEEQRACGEQLAARGVRALVIGSGPVPHDELAIDRARFTFVNVGGAPALRHSHWAGPDLAAGAAVVLVRLREDGRRRVGLVASSYALAHSGHSILAGWGLAPALGLDAVEPLINPGSGCEAAFGAWFDRNHPDAVVANDLRPLHWLRARGIDVPGEVSFCTLDVLDGGRAAAGLVLDRAGHLLAAIDALVPLLRQGVTGGAPRPCSILVQPSWCEGPTLRRRECN
ncbi:MAG: LacI family transcriptional regulator [Planctomycetes bacterium]|nr:LacI family transcriptional regulator [Planctomycetota bacterium]